MVSLYVHYQFLLCFFIRARDIQAAIIVVFGGSRIYDLFIKCVCAYIYKITCTLGF